MRFWDLTSCQVSSNYVHKLQIRSRKCFGKSECRSWPWDLTRWPKIYGVPPFIIHNFHVKFESDRAKTVAGIVPRRFYTQGVEVDLELWPLDQKSIGVLLSSSTTCIWCLRVIGLKLPTRFYTQSAQVDIDHKPRDPKSTGFGFLLSLSTTCKLKFESDQAETVTCIVRTGFYTQEFQSWPWPLTQQSKINRVPPLITHNFHVEVWKFLD